MMQSRKRQELAPGGRDGKSAFALRALVKEPVMQVGVPDHEVHAGGSREGCHHLAHARVQSIQSCLRAERL